jgi:hypothetical protein
MDGGLGEQQQRFGSGLPFRPMPCLRAGMRC